MIYNVVTLKEYDLKAVKELDAKHGGAVSSMLDSENYVFGLIIEEENKVEKHFVGYCTLGEVDGSGLETENIEDYLLSDVYIEEEYRKKHCGKKLIEGAIALKKRADEKTGPVKVFADIVDFSVIDFYRKIGFDYYINTDIEVVMVKEVK